MSAPEQDQRASSAGSDSDEQDAFVPQHDGSVAEGDEVYDLEGNERMDEDSDDEAAENQAPDVDHAVSVLRGHTDSVFAVSWSGQNLASGGQDDSVRLWQAGQSEPASTSVPGHGDSVSCVAYNASGTLLATGGLDGLVMIVDARTGRKLHELEGPTEGIEWLHWHPVGDVVVAGSEDFTAWMWNAPQAKCMTVFTGHNGSVRCGAFTADGRALVTGGGENDAGLRMWDPKTGTCTSTVQGHGFHTQGIDSLDLHPETGVAVSASEDGTLCLSSPASGRILVCTPGHTDSVEAVQFCPTLPIVASGGIDGKLGLWDAGTLAPRNACQHPAGITRLACLGQQPVVVSACLDGVVRCWDVRTGTCVRTLTGHASGIQDLALSPDERQVATASDDHTVRVFPLF